MKKSLALFLTVCMLLSFQTAALATNSTVAGVISIDGVSVAISHVSEFSAGSMSAIDEAAQAVQALIDDGQHSELEHMVNPKTRSYDAFYGTVTDSIATQDEIIPYGIFTLEPKGILQAGLECPDSAALDYDLYIAEVTAEGNIGTILTASNYTTHIDNGMTKTIDEGTDYINEGSTPADFCVLVHSKVGGDASKPYTLYVSTDIQGNYNTNEMDQNAAFPCATLNTNQTVTGAVLNSPADVDWFAINVNVDASNTSADFDMYITNPDTNAGLSSDSVELYKHIGNNKLEIVNRTNGVYSFTPEDSGEYYLRIMPGDRNTFSWHSYNLTVPTEIVHPVSVFEDVQVTKFSTDTDPNGTNYVRWPNYPESKYCLFNGSGNWFQVDGVLADGNGAAYENSGFLIRIEFTNHYWVGRNEDLAHEISTMVPVDSDGSFSVRINNMPVPAGKMYEYYNAGSNLVHFYDLATVAIRVFDSDYQEIAVFSEIVYHHSHAIQPF